MIYNLKGKTGFRSKADIVAVYTTDYEPFYVMKKKGECTYFNLPKGDYIIEVEVERLAKPNKFALPPLPKNERNIKRPREVKIVFGNNPNKCSIDLERGLIICDWSIKAKGRAEQIFVIYHEFGHYYYKTESSCDKYASRRMIEEGFNPSQTVFSVNGCLSDRSHQRKNEVYNFAKQVKRNNSII
jgi:hypothetical protein